MTSDFTKKITSIIINNPTLKHHMIVFFFFTNLPFFLNFFHVSTGILNQWQKKKHQVFLISKNLCCCFFMISYDCICKVLSGFRKFQNILISLRNIATKLKYTKTIVKKMNCTFLSQKISQKCVTCCMQYITEFSVTFWSSHNNKFQYFGDFLFLCFGILKKKGNNELLNRVYT